MRTHLKKFFIPHAENNYHPHILHAKRAWFYGLLAVLIKGMLCGVVLLLPARVFIMPDILALEQSRIIMITNNLREAGGLARLSENQTLDASAAAKAADMAEKVYFAHESPEGKRLANFLDQAGYKYISAGENLAIGYVDADTVVEAWLNSPLHRGNMFDRRFEEIGVSLVNGYKDGQETVYIAEHFGQPLIAGQVQINLSDSGAVGGLEVLAEKIVETAPVSNSTLSVISQHTMPFAKKYELASTIIGDTVPLFNFSKTVYVCLFIFFAFALLVNIFIQIRIQHKHVIIRTLGLLGVLVGLWLI